MKNLKIILITIVVACLGYSCEDDGGTSVIPLNDGAVPNMVKSATTDAFFDLVKLNNGENVTVSFRAEVAQGNPVSVDVVGIYRSSLGPVYATTLFSNASLPQDYSLSISDIVAAFAEINSSDDILLGDVLTITLRFTMADGTVLNIINDDGNNNVGTNIQTNVDLFTYAINYPVSCPSDIGGTYLVSSTGIGCCGVAPITNYEYTVIVTDNGGGSYSLSDFSGGAYDGLFCGPFGICGDASGGTITDVCGTLSGSAPDCCGDNITFTGVVNPDGTWDVEVSSGFILAESVWTKQ